MNIALGRAVLAGILGTIIMTLVGVWLAPMMGMPPMNPAEMLAGAMGGVMILGWAGHFMIGAILAVIYATVAPWLPGPPVLRGALFGIAPFLVAQVVVLPMMGMPFFSGSMTMAMGSLVGHLIYGGVVGRFYGPVTQKGVSAAEGVPSTAR
jgi:hypothetical protein